MGEWSALEAEFHSLEVARQRFPIWTDWGVQDSGSAIHSLGLSYLVTLCQSLGFVACSEFPVEGIQTGGGAIRADCVWWNAATRQPAAVFEFERFEPSKVSTLEDKVKNLLVAWNRWEHRPRLLALICWTKDFYTQELPLVQLRSCFQNGFLDADRVRVKGASSKRLRVYECQHRSDRAAFLRLDRFVGRDLR